MYFKHILVAVNSLNGRDAAFARALTLARSTGADLSLLHAVPANQQFSFAAAQRLERFDDMRERAVNAGVRVHAIEQHGDPADLIALHAGTRDVDLIVMGSEARRGRGRRRSAVAEKVVRRAHVPMLLVASERPDNPAPFRKVLAAVDLSSGSKDVIDAAAAVAEPGAAQLTVMHAVKGIEAPDAVRSPGRWMVPEFRTLVMDDARQTLEALVTDVPADLDTRVHVSAGSPSRAILDHASDLAADLVVVGGSRGMPLLGSTALGVLRKNDRALLVIPGIAHRADQVGWRRAA